MLCVYSIWTPPTFTPPFPACFIYKFHHFFTFELLQLLFPIALFCIFTFLIQSRLLWVGPSCPGGRQRWIPVMPGRSSPTPVSLLPAAPNPVSAYNIFVFYTLVTNAEIVSKFFSLFDFITGSVGNNNGTMSKCYTFFFSLLKHSLPFPPWPTTIYGAQDLGRGLENFCGWLH